MPLEQPEKYFLNKKISIVRRGIFSMEQPETFKVYAIRYAHLGGRNASEMFIRGDVHDGPMALDYFIWAAVGPAHTYVIDTGFNHVVAKRRGRTLLRTPSEGLALIGVNAENVQDVILTHLHYDHVGNFSMFPNARLHVQDKEVQYATGRHMREQPFQAAYELDDVVGLVKEVYKGRVEFHNGDAELSPGASVHFIGGHTMGMQCVRLWTNRGWLVLASDASHLYANMEKVAPFPIVFDVGQMVSGYRILRKLADSSDHIIPGHDPLVLKRYPTVTKELEGVAVRLDKPPLPSK